MAYKKQKLISHSLEAGKSQIMASAESISGLQMAIFSSCPYMSEKDKGMVWGLFYKKTNAIHEICALITYSPSNEAHHQI